MKICSIFTALLLVAVIALAQEKVIPLYNGPAPGSETWTWTEALANENSYVDKNKPHIGAKSPYVYTC